MALARIFRPPNVTAADYDAVTAEMNVEGNPPAGLLFHCSGEVDGGWQIIEVWESAEQAREFDEQRLAPAVEKVIGMRPPGEPPSTQYPLHKVIRP